MMNKQETIEKIEELKKCSRDALGDGLISLGIDKALNVVKQLDEPEKPVLSKEEAEWLERLKEGKGNELDLCDKADLLYYITREGFVYNKFGFYTDESDDFISLEKKDKTTKMRLVWALLIGYTLEPDKFYTAKLKSTGEYLHYDTYEDKVHHAFAFDSVVKHCKNYHFTKDTLVKYSAWENDAYDVREVEE